MSSSPLRSVHGARCGSGVDATQTLLLCVIVAVGGFEALWFGVAMDTGLAVLDPDVVAWLVARRGPGLVIGARMVSDVGSPVVMVSVAAVVVGWWAWRSEWRSAALGTVGVLALIGADVGMQAAVARPRPPVAWHAATVQGYAFPSGHALLSAGVILLLGGLVRRHDLLWVGRGPGIALVGSAGCFLAAVGASQVVLAVHFPSDVLSGWCLAVLVVAGVGFVAAAWMREVAE
jgi:membrane-associated phospholipid phosphatase